MAIQTMSRDSAAITAFWRSVNSYPIPDDDELAEGNDDGSKDDELELDDKLDLEDELELDLEDELELGREDELELDEFAIMLLPSIKKTVSK